MESGQIIDKADYTLLFKDNYYFVVMSNEIVGTIKLENITWFHLALLQQSKNVIMSYTTHIVNNVGGIVYLEEGSFGIKHLFDVAYEIQELAGALAETLLIDTLNLIEE